MIPITEDSAGAQHFKDSSDRRRQIIRNVLGITAAEHKRRISEISVSRDLKYLIKSLTPKPEKPVIVVIKWCKLECDLPLLQRYSKYFSNAVVNEVYSLPSSRVTAGSFSSIYQWMLNPDIIVPPNRMMEVYGTAVFLHIDLLINQYLEVISNPEFTHEENACHMYTGLRRMGMEVTFGLPVRIRKFFLNFVGWQTFLDLDSKTVAHLLSSPGLCVNTETEVLIAALFWLSYDCPQRLSELPLLMQSIHFTCIPIPALLYLRDKSSLKEVTHILRHPNFLEYLRYKSRSMEPRRFEGRRIWIEDPLCDYHHSYYCRKRHFVIIEQFLEFQRKLRSAPTLHWLERNRLSPYEEICRCCSSKQLRIDDNDNQNFK